MAVASFSRTMRRATKQKWFRNGLRSTTTSFEVLTWPPKSPDLNPMIEYIDAGITNTHYIRAPKGEIYRADHMRPQTPLKNLYLTGQDMFVCGFTLAGALTCGSVILNHNLHLEAIALAKNSNL
uniref:Uncharacterized protein n=1 Tax=Amphiprion ocellaris TaxID=80972 RepID=A0AAQ6AJE7_AMPOC